jgi:hypothetical protein
MKSEYYETLLNIAMEIIDHIIFSFTEVIDKM